MRGLPLDTVTLHWSGSISARFWQTTPLCPIFLLPELRSLTLSCVKIKVSETDFDVSGFKGNTKLESLAFIESIVSPDALEQILSYPKALKSLTVHEIQHHQTVNASFKFLKDDIEASHRALAAQAATLQLFDFSGQHEGRGVMASRRAVGFDLSNLRSLSHLRLNYSDLKLERPPPNLRLLCLQDLSPLTLRSGSEYILARLPKLDECLQSAAERGDSFQVDLGLFRIPVHFIGRMVRNGASEPRISIRRVFEDLRQKMIDKYTLLEEDEEDTASHGGSTETRLEKTTSPAEPTTDNVPVRLRILTSKRTRFVPPYLHGEKGSRWVVRYDSGILDNPYYDDSGHLEGDDSSEDEAMAEAFQLDSMF